MTRKDNITDTEIHNTTYDFLELIDETLKNIDSYTDTEKIFKFEQARTVFLDLEYFLDGEWYEDSYLKRLDSNMESKYWHYWELLSPYSNRPSIYLRG